MLWGEPRDFPKPDLATPSQFKNEQKLTKMVYIIPNFLGLHFGEIFMKIWTKIPVANFHEFLKRAIKAKNALHCC